MSFEWNLSSSSEGEETEDLESWTRRQGLLGPSSRRGNGTNDEGDDDDEGESSSFFMHDGFATVSGDNSSALQQQSNVFADDGDEEEEEYDEVDWEDADASSATGKHSLQPITIQLGSSETTKNGGSQGKNDSSNKNRKRRRRRQLFRFETLAPSFKALLQTLHNTHLLTLTSRAVGLSSTASDPEVLAVAHSLVPLAHTSPSTQQLGQSPTVRQAQAFYLWFIAFVHRVEERRARQQQANWAEGAPRQQRRQREQQQQGPSRSSSFATTDWKSLVLAFCSYLSQTNEQDPQLLEHQQSSSSTAIMLHNKETLVPLLLLAMIRSLGWRARFVQAMDVMPLDLSIDHPILTSGTPLFWTRRHAAASQTALPTTNTDTSSGHQENTALSKGGNSVALPLTTSSCIMSWIEVSCVADTSALFNEGASPAVAAAGNPVNSTYKPTKRKWIHVDPFRQRFNQPHQVESLWEQQQQDQAALSTLGTTSGEATVSSSTNSRQHRSNTSRSVMSRPRALQAKRRRPVAYVLAVEHVALLPTQAETDATPTSPATATTTLSPLQYMRVTDVTPRYAASWIASLRLRGLVRDKRALQLHNKTAACNPTSKYDVSQNRHHHDYHLNIADTWWSQTLLTLNHYSKDYHETQKLRTHGTTPDSAICLDLDDNDDGDRKPAAIDLASVQHALHHEDKDEVQELQASAASEAIPTSKAAFQTHPSYVIPSVLGVAEVLSPDAKKRVCGVFKGELVYKRTDVSTALPARKWPYHRRKVRHGERPVKVVKARRKATPKTFRALSSYGVGASNDGSRERRAQDIALAESELEDGTTEPLFAMWQTDPWSPAAVGPNDPIPVNDYKNVELELLNPGLVHINVRGAAKVAKQLSIPYAPCLMGFEGHGGNRTPTIRGIVVHQHNAEMIREAMSEVNHFEAATEHENRRRAILLKWKKLMVGLLTKDRLEREYGDGNDNE